MKFLHVPEKKLLSLITVAFTQTGSDAGSSEDSRNKYGLAARMHAFAPGNESRDFWRAVDIPVELVLVCLGPESHHTN